MMQKARIGAIFSCLSCIKQPPVHARAHNHFQRKMNFCPEMNHAAQAARKKNLTWSIARQNDPEHQKVPSWTGFNIRTKDQVPVSDAGFGIYLQSMGLQQS